ncbi:MAG: type IV pilus twitching motility protein PilT [Phycisphaerales bacterium]
MLEAVLELAESMKASDVHLVVGRPPTARVWGEMQEMPRGVLSAEEVEGAFAQMAEEGAREAYARQQDADFSWQRADGARYRVNAHRQREGMALSIRRIAANPPRLTELGLPPAVEKLTRLSRGLVLVTGHTGSGKTTTLAAMVEEMNRRDRKHIITLEDPIEFLFESKQCLIEQRELGRDTPSFSSALRHALRQDPDVLLVGEMRDYDTAALAISAAETGHLVLATLHTLDASRTVERIIDMFPGDQQNQVRSMLSDTLQGVVSQTLVPRMDGTGMVAAVEVLVTTPAVRNIVRESRTFEIPNVIETNKALGMRTLDAAISELYLAGVISREEALARAVQPERMDRQLAA